MSTSHSILFLSGAGLPPWIWDAVRARLGETCETCETQVAPRPRDATALRDYAEAAVGCLTADRVTVVAHSAGGVVGAEVLRLAPERVTGLLAVGAIVPKPRGSFVTSLPVPNRWILSAVMRVAGTRPPESAIRGTLANGVDEPTVERLIADFTPEPQSFYRDRIGHDSGWSGPRGYLVATGDRELPPHLQHRYADRLGATWRRELPTGHLPMLTDPDGLTDVITGFLHS